MKKNICLVGILLVAIWLGKLLLGINYLFVMKWWTSLLILGVGFFPITSIVFKKFSDSGWMFSKIIGLAISGITVWYLSYIKILKYTQANCYIIIGLLFLVNLVTWIKNKKDINIDKNKLKSILITEIVFFTAFSFWAYIRSYSPTVDCSTEKFMNYGFLNALLNTEYMPAEDMWFSGYSINYYYFGQYIASFLTKISNSTIKEGFNLFVVLVNTCTFMLPCMIGYNLGKYLVNDEEKTAKRLVPTAISILSGIAVSLAGTLYYPIYNFIVDRNAEPINGQEYYYWEDTRYIGYRPDTNDKTINEIVPYSNMVGDLHAHHIDTMFVFLALALLLTLILDDQKGSKQRLFSLRILFLGIILGIQKMTNYWDFPIYLVVICITIIFNNLTKYKFKMKNILLTLCEIIEVILIQVIATVPFTLDLHISATKVCLTHVTSPFYKLMVLYGLPTLCVVWLIAFLIKKFVDGKEKGKIFKQLFEYISNIKKTDLFIFIIGCCAIGLFIIPEIIYVKDIYDDEYKRANTMYKVCYQADILFDLSMTYILIRLLYEKGVLRKVFVTLLLIVFITTFGYGINAINYVTGRFDTKLIKPLDATEDYMREWHIEDYKAIQWIKENIDKDDIILEKASGSYSINSSISVFTGNPTILGWHGHEWIWRAEASEDGKLPSPKEEDERWNDIWRVYDNNECTGEELRNIVAKYNISYIYAGGADYKIEKLSDGELLEQKRQENLDNLKYLVNEKLSEIGTIVYQSENLDDIVNVPVYIIKIN